MIQLLLWIGLLSPFSAQETVQATAPPYAAGKITHAVDVRGTSVTDAVYEERFETLNDISLDDRTEDVLQKKGQPLRTHEDLILRSTEYHYEDVVVGVRDGYVNYVHVDSSSVRVKVNDRWLPLDRSTLDHELGGAQFTAEDGEVYIRGHHAIKVYTDQDSGELKAVELFDETSSP
ncbi:hypothetical protein [Paenibacillus massiliensis]|uniref:hypothetical protein n=1 Tax=Paenibacillus massiliensis TaxID=225917 RepID=UPI00047013A4|nr:hypothetical protein [Paenibacillus massiliensis]